MFVNIHFQNKQLILHEILIGPRCVMVPVGSVAYLKTTSTNNSIRRNIHNNMRLNLSKSCNYYHHRVTISTRGTEICSRDFVSVYIFVNISPKYNVFTIHLHKWNKISILDFEYRSTLQIFIQIFVKICKF